MLMQASCAEEYDLPASHRGPRAAAVHLAWDVEVKHVRKCEGEHDEGHDENKRFEDFFGPLNLRRLFRGNGDLGYLASAWSRTP